MAFELPLFPLNVVLFPGMPLPLHVFEARYRLMMKRVLANDRTFGVALLIEGEEGETDTVPAPAGCMAEVTEVAPFPDGRMNLQSVGRRRFRVLSVREEDEYLIGTCEWLDDEFAPAAVPLQELMCRVRNALYRFISLVAEGAGAPPPFDLNAPIEPEPFSLWVAGLLSVPDAQKQELLEMTATPARLERELSLLERAQIVQQAWTQRQSWLQEHPPAPDAPDNYAPFLSPN